MGNWKIIIVNLWRLIWKYLKQIETVDKFLYLSVKISVQKYLLQHDFLREKKFPTTYMTIYRRDKLNVGFCGIHRLL